MLQPIVIPSAPKEVYDPTNLLNGVYPWVPVMSWYNPEVHDRIACLREAQPFEIVAWATPYAPSAGPGPGAKEFRGPTTMAVVLPNGREYGVDLVNIGIGEMDMIAYSSLYQFANNKPAPAPLKYPGYLTRHPAEGKDPVGPEWPEHLLNAAGRKIFHTSPQFNDVDWPYRIFPQQPTEFWRSDGRYTLAMSSTSKGSWLGGGITEVREYRWEFTPNLQHQG